jgi:hypothetical protein
MLGTMTKRTVFRHTHVKGVHVHWNGDDQFEVWVDGKLHETLTWEDGKLHGPRPPRPMEFDMPIPTEAHAGIIAETYFEEQGYR